MVSSKVSPIIKDKLVKSLALTKDGIGIFDDNDILIYCNPTLASMFDLTPDLATGKTFEAIIEHNYQTKSGLNIETDYLPDWLDVAKRLRRSKKFRSFEVDFHNGRHFLVTEHTSRDHSILTFCSEITLQKNTEKELHKLNQVLFYQASHDSLTNILNRHSFYEKADIELSRAHRINHTIAFFMFDLDHFKLINDTFGHQGGDVVLKEFSIIVQSQLRDYDIFGRVGGEEFALFLPEIDEATAESVGNRILEKVRRIKSPGPLESLKVSVSAGMVMSNDDSRDLMQLAKCADEALYKSKYCGRDRLSVAD